MSGYQRPSGGKQHLEPEYYFSQVPVCVMTSSLCDGFVLWGPILLLPIVIKTGCITVSTMKATLTKKLQIKISSQNTAVISRSCSLCGNETKLRFSSYDTLDTLKHSHEDHEPHTASNYAFYIPDDKPM